MTSNESVVRPEPFVVDVPPPRANGEIVFDAPWQSRLFGLTAALAEREALSWADVQSALIAEVQVGDHDTGTPSGYWQCWLRAVGRLEVVETEVWSDLVDELSRREVGHDHRH